jgi:hypothetical protein
MDHGKFDHLTSWRSDCRCVNVLRVRVPVHAYGQLLSSVQVQAEMHRLVVTTDRCDAEEVSCDL